MYEMVMGAAPFQAATAHEMMEAEDAAAAVAARQERPDPPALDAIVAAAMAPDPERRPQTMARWSTSWPRWCGAAPRPSPTCWA